MGPSLQSSWIDGRTAIRHQPMSLANPACLLAQVTCARQGWCVRLPRGGDTKVHVRNELEPSEELSKAYKMWETGCVTSCGWDGWEEDVRVREMWQVGYGCRTLAGTRGLTFI